jgi:LemA protein
MSAGLMILVALLLAVLVGGGCAASKYNSMVDGQESVDQKFSEIDNQYTRRNELIPQLMGTVKGAADYEKGVLTEVTNARASVGKMQIPAQATANPQAAADYIAAQQGLGAAVGRMLLTVEKYPTLKATDSFRDMQSQIEGTENRIGVARRDYIDAVKGYNTSVRQFPGNLIAGVFGFERMPQLEAAPDAREVPSTDFSQ